MVELQIGRDRKLILGKKKIENPAWDYVKALPDDDLYKRFGERYPSTFELKDNGEYIGHRARFTRRWAWAIPSPDILDDIVEILDGRSIVDMGAGNGYWAWMLSQYGVDVNAYDLYPIGHEQSWFADKYLKDESVWSEQNPIKEFFPVIEAGVEALAKPENADRVLFLCWPPYDNPFAYEAAKTFQGDTILYIGEDDGCTADWQFRALMGEREGFLHDDDEDDGPSPEWERIDSRPMVQWAGIHDNLYVYRRLES